MGTRASGNYFRKAHFSRSGQPTVPFGAAGDRGCGLLKDDDPCGSYEHTSFDFLGYTPRPWLARSRFGKHFVNFSAAVSSEAKTAMRREIRRWRLHLRPHGSPMDAARVFNVVLQGWIDYYGRF